MSLTGSLLLGESSMAMNIRLLKEYGGLDVALHGGCGGSRDSSSWGSGAVLTMGGSGSRSLLWCSQLRQVRSSWSAPLRACAFSPSKHCDVAQCESGDEDWMDSAVAGDSDAGDGGREVGDSGSSRRPVEQLWWGEEENGSDPSKAVGNSEEVGSVWGLLSISKVANERIVQLQGENKAWK